MKLGKWDLDNLRSVNLPQKVQSAFTAVTADLVGADFIPVLYVGKQLVNGTNYCVLAVQKPVTREPETHLFKLVIHETLDGHYELAGINGVLV